MRYQYATVSPTIAEVVTALPDLKVKRVTTAFTFQSCEDYTCSIEILVQNTGTKDCWVVPSTFYDKKVLVAFSARDSEGGQPILTPSHQNDEILLKLLFYHSWSRADPDSKKLLYRAFVGPDVDSVNTATVEQILLRDFKGELYHIISDSMWSGLTSIREHLSKPMVNFVPEAEREAYCKLAQPTLIELCWADYAEFFQRLHKRFFQLMWMNNPIKQGEYLIITVEDQRFLAKPPPKGVGATPSLQRKTMGFGRSEVRLPIEFDALTPFHVGTAFHFRIVPPEGVKLDLRPSRASRALFDCQIYATEEVLVDRSKLEFYHQYSKCQEPCDKIQQVLQLDSRTIGLSNNDSYLRKTNVSDTRTRFEMES